MLYNYAYVNVNIGLLHGPEYQSTSTQTDYNLKKTDVMNDKLVIQMKIYYSTNNQEQH